MDEQRTILDRVKLVDKLAGKIKSNGRGLENSTGVNFVARDFFLLQLFLDLEK